MAAFPLHDDIDYPESDGQPLGETPRHQKEIIDLIYSLRRRYEETPDVYVAGNMFLYYVRGDRDAVVCPDVFVVRGVEKRDRDVYKLWEEGGRAPSLVVEVTSFSSRTQDLVKKKSLYARLGVEEYFLFDPLDEYLSPPLQGFRLMGRRYRPIHPEPDGSLPSEVTGLMFCQEGGRLRLVDRVTGERLVWIEELEDRIAAEVKARLSAELLAAEEAKARLSAEARAAKEEQARLSAEARAAEEEQARLSAEARAAEEEQARRSAEARAAAAEEELARLRRVLAERAVRD